MNDGNVIFLCYLHPRRSARNENSGRFKVADRSGLIKVEKKEEGHHSDSLNLDNFCPYIVPSVVFLS